MSRLARRPLPILASCQVKLDPGQVVVTGPKGSLTVPIPAKISLKLDDQGQSIVFTRLGQDKQTRASFGSLYSHLRNAINGTVNGFTKEIEIRGTGYKAQASGSKLTLRVGFIHPVEFTAPEGIVFTVPEETRVIISGFDRQLVGQIASSIRKVRPPEPYKGKGIRYLGELVRQKAGKTAKA